MYGLYKKTIATHYDGQGTEESEVLLGTDFSPRTLVNRWNKWASRENKKGLSRVKTPQMIPGTRQMRFNGNTGGGFFHVEHTLEIRKVDQWDKEE